MCDESSWLQNEYGLVLGVLSFAVTGCVFEGSTAGEGHGKKYIRSQKLLQPDCSAG